MDAHLKAKAQNSSYRTAQAFELLLYQHLLLDCIMNWQTYNFAYPNSDYQFSLKTNVKQKYYKSFSIRPICLAYEVIWNAMMFAKGEKKKEVQPCQLVLRMKNPTPMDQFPSHTC